PTKDADGRKFDRWMLEVYNEHDGAWTWRNFDGLDGVLKKKIRRDGSLSLLEAIKVSHELWRRHGNNLRWRRVRGEDHVRVYDLGRLATLLKRLRRDAGRTRSGTSAAKS